MALTGKLEAEIEIDAPAEKFYKVWKSECFHLPTASPSNIQAVDVHEGDWETGGSIKIWKYTVEGRTETFKEKVETDDEHMTVTIHGIEGDIYKSLAFYKPTCKAIPKETAPGCIAKLTIEYERRNKDAPDPTAYLDLMISVTRDVSAHIMKP